MMKKSTANFANLLPSSSHSLVKKHGSSMQQVIRTLSRKQSRKQSRKIGMRKRPKDKLMSFATKQPSNDKAASGSALNLAIHREQSFGTQDYLNNLVVVIKEKEPI